MIYLRCSVLKARPDVVFGQVRVVLENFGYGGPGSQQRQDVGDAHTGPANDRATVDDLRIDDDTFEQGHVPRIPSLWWR